MKYFDEIKKSMEYLAMVKNTVFLGQAVSVPGTAMFNTLKDIDLKKKIEFIPGNSLKNGSGFGINTHLGYVGAIVNGEPIIFHAVHGTVHATPLSKMGNTKVIWVKTGPTGTVVNPEETSPSWWESFTRLF